MSTPRQFAADISRFADRVGATVDELQRAVFGELFGSVIGDTPVLSGRLRGNWQASKSAPELGVLETSDPTGVATIAKAVAAIGDSGVYFLTNNLPYAERIEFDGHSSIKAPAGMVRINAMRLAQVLADEARK